MGRYLLRRNALIARRLKHLIAVLLLLSAAGVAAQDGQYSTTGRIDWETGELSLTVVAPVPAETFNAPTSLYRVEQEIERDMPELLVEFLLSLPVDSRYRIQDRLRQNPELVQELGSLFARGRKEFTRRTPDLRQIEVRYTFSLFPDIAGIFFTHTRPFPVDRVIHWVPTRRYSGIVIHAKGDLPLHGTSRRVPLQPCLYPEIYDENMRLVLERLMVDPEAVARWGIAAYTDSIDEGPFLERIGLSPLRIVADGVFGSIPTDLKIAAEYADEILAHEANRRLLTEGRILIIIESESLVPPLNQ